MHVKKIVSDLLLPSGKLRYSVVIGNDVMQHHIPLEKEDFKELRARLHETGQLPEKSREIFKTRIRHSYTFKND